jgi:hypothetical protein
MKAMCIKIVNQTNVDQLNFRNMYEHSFDTWVFTELQGIREVSRICSGN